MCSAGDKDQRELSQLWKKARKDGCMSPWQQARVYGLNEAWAEIHGEKTYGKHTWIAERVRVQGRGQKRPSPQAIGQCLQTMSDDDEWRCVSTLAGHTSTVWGLAFCPNGQVSK